MGNNANIVLLKVKQSKNVIQLQVSIHPSLGALSVIFLSTTIHNDNKDF